MMDSDNNVYSILCDHYLLTPSFSFSISTFLRATIFFVFLWRALNTSPNVPCPILAIFSYLFTSSQKGNSSSSKNFSRSFGFIDVIDVAMFGNCVPYDLSPDINRHKKKLNSQQNKQTLQRKKISLETIIGKNTRSFQHPLVFLKVLTKQQPGLDHQPGRKVV